MEKNKAFITANDSKALYGMAILFMLYHHLFLDPARLNYNYVSVLGKYAELEIRLAWICKICVGIYAFISGYAMCLLARKLEYKDFSWQRIKGTIFLCLKQLGKFYRKFWLVFVIFVPIGVIFFEQEGSFKTLIRGWVFGEYYNDAWWYVKQYLYFMLLFPILDAIVLFFEKCSKRIVIFVGVFGCVGMIISRIFFWNDTWISRLIISLANIFCGIYTLIFIIAYLCARYRLFEKVDIILHKYSWSSFVGMMGVFFARGYIITTPGQSMCDIILVPMFVYFTVSFLHTSFAEKYVTGFLRYFGKYSTFMWLVHNFYAYYYFQDLVLVPKYSLLIFIWLIILSLVTAILFDVLEKKLKIDVLRSCFRRIKAERE